MSDLSAASSSIVTEERLRRNLAARHARDVRAAIERGVLVAKQAGGRAVASVILPLPKTGLESLALYLDTTGEDAFFWRPPGQDCAFLGTGVAHAIEVTGPDRFASAQATWNELSRAAVIERAGSDPVPGENTTGPVLLGGFAFDPLSTRDQLWEGFPDGLLILPRLLVTHGPSGCWLSLNAVVDANCDPKVEAESLCRSATLLEEAISGLPADSCTSVAAPSIELDEEETVRWMEAVALAAQAVRSGQLQKAVLARKARARLGRRPLPGRTLAALMGAYPECYAFLVRRQGRTFLGATPERLVALDGSEVRTMCLAGSIARGRSPEEDEQLGKELLSDPKNLREHRVVVDMIRSALEDLCERLDVAASPALLKMRNVQHLFTPVSGKLKAPCSLLELVARLHPTPAVGGQPTERALELIRKIEGMDRGWYAGPVGWVGPQGDGEFAVALRSALLAGDEAVLFAGCGIVGDSNPRAELEESALKMRAVLQALERSL